MCLARKTGGRLSKKLLLLLLFWNVLSKKLCYAYRIIKFLGLSCFIFQFILLSLVWNFWAKTSVICAGMEMSHLVCGGCRTLLMYTRGATSVRCSCCQTINHARTGTFSKKNLQIIHYHPLYCFEWFHFSRVELQLYITYVILIVLQVAVLHQALFGKRIKFLLPEKYPLLFNRWLAVEVKMALWLQISFCKSQQKRL